MIKRLSLKSQKPTVDIPLIVSALILVVFGLAMIFDASVVSAYRDFGDKFYYFKNQLIWASLGIISLSLFSFIDYHKLLKFAPTLLAFAVLLLILVLIPQIGTKVYGARRWINIASFTFQPSEFAKLALIIYTGAIMTKFQNYKLRIFDVAYVLFLPTFFLIGLVLLEPDFGTALIFAGVILAMYFLGGGAIWHFFLIGPLLAGAALLAVFTSPYRLDRLKTFLDPTFDPQGASYQINQILTSIVSGGALGVGIGGSRGKFDFIPEVHSDAIFAVVAEELGFAGGLFLIGLLLFLIFRSLAVARAAPDFEGKVLACGIIALIAIQAFLNLASIVALVPLTGIPLPFISYGGSSLLVNMIAIGILTNVKRQSV